MTHALELHVRFSSSRSFLRRILYFRRECRCPTRVNRRLSLALRPATKIQVLLTKDPNPKPRKAEDIPIELKDETDAREVFDKIANLLGEKRYRPHFFTKKEFLRSGNILRDQAFRLAKDAYADLKPLITYFNEILERREV